MKTRKIQIILCLFVLLLCGSAHARDADGRLGLIRYPVSTVPEFVRPGGQLALEIATPGNSDMAGVAGETRVFLEKNGSSISIDPVGVTPSGAATSSLTLSLAIPLNVAPGCYDLRVNRGDKSDVSRHAVFVVAEYPAEYKIMHITDIHVGRMADGAPVGEREFARMKDEANRIGPDLVIITGDLSDSSDPAEFRKFIEIDEQFQSPTFTVPGNHDRNNSDADTFLGPSRYTFYFGKHFYLGFDTQYEFPTPDPSGQLDWIIRMVRANRSAPFKVLFSHRLDSDFHLVLTRAAMPFKVNLMLLGHTHEDNVLKLGALPSLIVTSPAALDGYYRIVRVKDDSVADMKLENINK